MVTVYLVHALYATNFSDCVKYLVNPYNIIYVFLYSLCKT